MMRKILFILSALFLLAGCSKTDVVARLAEVYDHGTEQIKDASDMESFKKATAAVVTAREKLKGEVSAADFEKAAKDDKVAEAERRYAGACMEKVADLGVGALKNVLSTSDADLTKLIDDAAGLLQDNSDVVDDFADEFDKAINDAAEDFQRSLEEAKKASGASDKNDN